MCVAAHMLLFAVQMCVVVNTCCILAAVLLQVKAGLTMSQHCNVEVGSLSIRSKHLQLICTAGCCVQQVSASFVAFSLSALLPRCLMPNCPCLDALLPCCARSPIGATGVHTTVTQPAAVFYHAKRGDVKHHSWYRCASRRRSCG